LLDSNEPFATIACDDRWLVVRFPTPHATASWAVVGGGLGLARAVAWHHVAEDELPPEVEPSVLLEQRLAAAGISDAVGLLTGRRLDRFTDERATVDGSWARCIATVGLSNAVRVGDLPGPLGSGPGRVGTINLLCQLGAPLAPVALLEALAVAVEARTAAVLDAGRPSQRSAGFATGTGTDCVVIAAPAASGGARYAGTHMPIGAAIGQAVYAAVRRGAEAWKEEWA
jgi:adenosylcobinamide amidohydrolase